MGKHTALPNSEQLAKLKRRMGDNAASALAPPAHWQSVRDPMIVEFVDVCDGPEKEKVVSAFRATLPPSVRVLEVQRVQNVSMWQSYAVKRSTVLAREQKGKQSSHAQGRFERVWLFHGTDEETVPKITQQGFNRSFCGRNATMYGKGVYFAAEASYSSSRTYAKPNAQGVQQMLMCRVVIGEYCKGVRDALTPSVRHGNQLYDSTVDNESNPSIYVTYHDAQAYPEYLVKFCQ